LASLEAGDVLLVTKLDRLARSTRDLLNTLAAITDKGASFKSLGDPWADTTTPHGKLMVTILGGIAEFERHLILSGTDIRLDGTPRPPDPHIREANCYRLASALPLSLATRAVMSAILKRSLATALF
jgi:DNA invertase Pin-like site-specific DNA recombinase